MTDIYTKEKRSEIMSSVRSRGNKATEMVVVKMFREHGIHGWRRHLKMLGSPNFVFRGAGLIVFVDGCFWHGCLKHFKMPKTNSEFWERRITTNVRRDKRVRRELRSRGWSVIGVWQHELSQSSPRFLSRVKRHLENESRIVG